MRLLADTQVLIWALLSPQKLSARAAAALQNPEHEIFCSVATVWEMAIKLRLKKLELGATLEEFVAQHRANNIHFLPVRVAHAVQVAELPLHHRDPFDRLLIAQAMQEKLRIITVDPAFARYPISTVW